MKAIQAAHVCSLSKEELEERDRAFAELKPGVRGAKELSDGFELRFSGEGEWATRISGLIEKERCCCSSVAFELRFAPEQGPITLVIRGNDDDKRFFRERLASLLEPPRRESR